uniref:Uncharacterized protein n=1 Tax=Desertifilum tharense IPPAS B-1220 TaxID=1781255 RepID=A0ACD5H183_9CYAN
MSDVVQWLAQIKELKEQLAQAQQERDEAYATASNWQRLYDTEYSTTTHRRPFSAIDP